MCPSSAPPAWILRELSALPHIPERIAHFVAASTIAALIDPIHPKCTLHNSKFGIGIHCGRGARASQTLLSTWYAGASSGKSATGTACSIVSWVDLTWRLRWR